MRFVAAAVVAGIAVVIAVSAASGGDTRTVNVELTNAGGLRDGSAVVRGGTEIGELDLRLDRNDRLIAQIKLRDDAAPIATDSRIAVTAVNLLGRKRLEVIGGSEDKPAADGATLPGSSVSTATDLDQVLAVLDSGTRTRLQILLSEAGRAVVGRRTDISRLLAELPPTLPESTRLFDGLAADNRKLASLLDHSDGLLAAVVPERRALTRMVDGFADLSTSVARQRGAVRETLRRASTTLAAMRGFLAELQSTTPALGPAARRIATATGPLADTLQALGPVRNAAEPALRAATDISPDLTTLARAAAPTLKAVRPVGSRLTQFATELRPVSRTLDHSIDDILAIVDNWTRAVQLRDGLSHVFRGQASMTPETLRSLLDRLAPTSERTGERQPNRAAEQGPAARRPAAPSSPPKPAPGDRTVPAVKDLLAPVQDLLDDVTGSVGPKRPDAPSVDGVETLLHYLLAP